jgi:TonB family protein
MLIFILRSISCLVAQEVRDKDIRVGNFQEMRYPLEARLLHIQGVVVVRAKLDKDGKVIDAQAISGARSLIPDTLTNVKTWNFAPNTQKTVVIVYHFKIEDGLCMSELSSQFVFYPPNLMTVRSCEPVVMP